MQIAEAEKQVNLLSWAAQTATNQGMPQASMIMQKAVEQAQALAVLKSQQENAEKGRTSAQVASAPVTAPVAASVAASVASGSAADKKAIEEAQRTADMLTWAAKTCAQQGLPQAAMMQAKAHDAVAALEALKKGSPVPAATAPASIAKEDCPVLPTLKGATKEEIREAEKHAYLLSWSAETARKQGMPQAALLETRALAAVKVVEDLKACKDNDTTYKASPVASVPAAQVPAAQVKVSKAEFLAAKKSADLLVWAARNAAAQGMPQATQMQAKADAALAKIEAMALA
eukprot:CAMPEP_0180583660 /NCGR_PEP_ID=MMETSP1037_2-20121125/15186_1 /TAXON_ID=632150 /ORGANISM="Azadinium spinosum, Strain 3D9" /LENGTH=287 /DNA_ID=CAMNT_0022601689 /DNA_START=175 /DNA_END=1038 /DNA_ORIENTATION=-